MIELLNNDDSLELFKETSPSPTLLQLRDSKRAVAHEGHGLLSRLLAICGNNVDFTKVIAMIDEMLSSIKQEQMDVEN